MFCEDVYNGGSFALMRHVPQGNTWFQDSFGVAPVLVRQFHLFFHFTSDDLNGTSNYGLYAQSLTSSNAFSVPFASRVKDDLQYMFMTGDRTSWLVVLRQQLGISTGLGSISLAPFASSASSCMFRELCCF